MIKQPGEDSEVSFRREDLAVPLSDGLVWIV